MYLGIDIENTSARFALVRSDFSIIRLDAVKPDGGISEIMQSYLKSIKEKKLNGIGVTGIDRKLVKALVSADLDVDEASAYQCAAGRLHSKSEANAAIGCAFMCIEKGIDNRRAAPQIDEFIFIEDDKCYECTNRCGAAVIRIKRNGE